MFFIIIHGLSGSGKTEASKCLSKLLGVEEIHPIAPWKRFTEKYYGLPEGALDTTEYKEYTPNGMNITMNQFMVNLYHFMRENDPYFSSRMMRTDHISEGIPTVLLSLRNLEEVEVIESMLSTLINRCCIVINISRSSEQVLSSDVNYQAIKDRLARLNGAGVHYIDIVNDYQKVSDLKKALERLLKIYVNSR
jgi:broad-specificity NMP kinase